MNKISKFLVVIGLLVITASCSWEASWSSDGEAHVGDVENGQGTYYWKNGDKYDGEWKGGKKNGQGTFTWASGEKYVGEFKDDKRNGQGTYTEANGTVKSGLWENGNFVK